MERSPFNGPKMVFNNWIAICKRMKLDPYFSIVQINSKWIKHLNVRAKTINSEGNTGARISNDFLRHQKKANKTKEKRNWPSSKLKTSEPSSMPSRK